MEDESGGQNLDSPSKTFSEWLDDMCAYYMAIGVTCDEYWHGDYTNLRHYVKAHELKNEQRNQEMWLQGLYNFRAFESVIGMFSWGMGGKKGKKPDGYIDRPIRLTEKTESEKAAEAEKERLKIIADLSGWEQAWKSKYKQQ